MRNEPSKLIIMTALFFVAVTSALAQSRPRPPAQPRPAVNDLTLKQRMTFGGQSMESTTLIKGARQRSEMNTGMGMDMVNITQCDLRRTIQISDRTKKYMISLMAQTDTSDTTEGAAPAPEPSTPARRGGTVTYTVTTTDTGERKQMFGFPARHLKTSMVVEPSPDACAQGKQRIETDGWYIDFGYEFNCSQDVPMARMGRPQRPGCQDRIRYRHIGRGRPGYPVNVTTTMYGPDGNVQTTMTTEVLELSRATLDPALFDVPAGYTETKNAQELYGMPSMSGIMEGAMGNRPRNDAGGNEMSGAAATKRPGTIRIGVVAINNKTDHAVSVESLRERLTSSLTGSNVDAVALNASSPAEAEAEAGQKQCDFILYTDISSLKQASAGRKVGGLLGRAAGVGSMGVDKSESRVDFRLVPVGSSSPQLESSATAKEEGDEASVGTALEREARMVIAGVRKKR